MLMVRRLTLRGIAIAGMALALAVLSSPSQAATATSLVLPQGTAFSILGHSCGGIQEKAYATGFDAASGYPVGVVQMSTSCGGSGRGGGYHTTTYTASAGVTWDFTGAVVTYVVPAPGGTLDPAFSAFDAYGNEVYNQSGRAFLLLADGFVPVARVTSVAPTTGPAAGGTTVTITGTGFSAATGVSFGSAPAASFTVVSATSITAISPATAAGTVDVTVVDGGGASATSAADQFTFVSTPTVTGLSPRSGSPGGGTAVTITGTNLSGATRVTFGGTPAGFDVNGDTSLTAYAPAAEEAGAVDVRVTSIGGTSPRVTADRFSYVATRPIVTGLSPNAGPQDGGTEVTITGSSLSGVSEVDFGGVPASFWINDDTSITAFPQPAAPGTADVTVVAYGLRSARSASDLFTFLPTPPPTVTGVSPGSGPETGGTLVTITGTNLTNTLEVDFGGVAAEFGVYDDSTLVALTPAGIGTVDVTVTTDGGTSAAGSADAFTFLPAPTVTSVSPATGPAAGGTTVTITGTNLADASEVDFGGVPASFTVNGDGSITAVSPAGGAGAVDVTVTSDGGTSAAGAGDQFTYT
jgi:hypothetical protein